MTVRVVTFDDNVASAAIPTSGIPTVTEVQFENNGVRVGDQNTTKINFNDNLTAALDPADATTVIINGQAGGGGSGGHIIEDAAGTDLAQRANLQFTGATVTDDATNDRTVVAITGGSALNVFHSQTNRNNLTTSNTILEFNDSEFQRIDSDYSISTNKQRIILNTTGDYEITLSQSASTIVDSNLILQTRVNEFDDAIDTTGTQLVLVNAFYQPIAFSPAFLCGGTETVTFMLNLTAGKELGLTLSNLTLQTGTNGSHLSRITLIRLP